MSAPKKKVFMQSDDLFVPENPFTSDLNRMKEEKKAKEAAEALLAAEKAKQEEINERLQKLEMLPMLDKIVILPYPVNPYRKVMEGSIIVEYTGTFNNPDSGEEDKLDKLVGCAKVIEVGPTTKHIKVGDDVYYDTRTVAPLPFMSMGYKILSELSVLAVLNEGLKDRFNM